MGTYEIAVAIAQEIGPQIGREAGDSIADLINIVQDAISRPEARSDNTLGVWVAYHVGESTGAVPFKSELHALRHAVSQSMQVQFFHWGEIIK